MNRILVFLPLLISLHVVAQTGTVRGTITTSNGNPAGFVTVRLDKFSTGAVTNATGSYTIENVPGGLHTVTASFVGYNTQTKEITSTDGQIVTVDFVLTEAEANLSEVVVSASRTKESIDEIPSSVAVIGLKTLQDNLDITTNLGSILENRVPGLAPSAGLSSNFGQTLRGRNMLVMVDGVPQSTPLRNGGMDIRALDPSVIERVEVVKGATAIYGNGAAGGLINYFTRNPKTGKFINSHTTIGTSGSLTNKANSMGGRVSQLLYGDKGKLSYVLGGVYEQTGEQKDAAGDVLPPIYGLGETDSYNAFAKIGYQLTNQHKVQATYNVYSSRQTTNYLTVNGDYKNGIKTSAKLGESQGVPQGVRGNHNLNILFTGNTGVANTSYDVSAYYQSVDNVFFYSTAFVDGGVSRVLSKKQGVRLVLNTPLKLSTADASLTYGLDAQRDITSQPLVDGRIWVPEMNMQNMAPFAQARVTFFEKLILKGGLRYEKVRIGVDDYNTLPSVNVLSGAVTPSIKVKGGDLTYNPLVFNLGLRYNVSPYFSPYVSFSQGFTVSDVGLALRAARVDDVAKINTKAVIVDSYEAGFVSKIGTLRFEAIGYVSKSSLGSNSVFQNGSFVVVRAPERIYGLELTADAQLTKNLRAGLNYSYVEGKLDANDDGNYNGPEDEYLPGARIAPPMLTGNVNYTLLPNKLTFLLQYTGIMKRNRFAKNSNNSYDYSKGPVKAYNLFSTAINYQFFPSTSLSLGIENLFNEDYYPARSQWTALNDNYIKGSGAAYRLTLHIKM